MEMPCCLVCRPFFFNDGKKAKESTWNTISSCLTLLERRELARTPQAEAISGVVGAWRSRPRVCHLFLGVSIAGCGLSRLHLKDFRLVALSFWCVDVGSSSRWALSGERRGKDWRGLPVQNQIRSDRSIPISIPISHTFLSLLSFSSKANQGWIKGSSTPVFKHPKTCWMYSIYKAVVDHTASCVQKHPQNPDRWSRIFRATFDKKPCSGTRRTRSTLPATLPEMNKPLSSFSFPRAPNNKPTTTSSSYLSLLLF